MAGDGAKLLLVITVDIGDGRKGDIQVHENQRVDELAEAFVAEHGLARAVVPSLAKHIEGNLAGVMKRKRERAVARAAAAAKAATSSESQPPDGTARQAEAGASSAKPSGQGSSSSIQQEKRSESEGGNRSPISRRQRVVKPDPVPLPASSQRLSVDEGLRTPNKEAEDGGLSLRRTMKDDAEREAYYNKLQEHYQQQAEALVRPQTDNLSPPQLRNSATPTRHHGSYKQRGARSPAAATGGGGSSPIAASRTAERAVARRAARKRDERGQSGGAATRGGDHRNGTSKAAAVYTRLYRNAADRRERAKSAKAVLEIAEAQTATRGVRMLKPGQRHNGPRLHAEGLKHRETIEKSHREHIQRKAQTDLSSCTFRPEISELARSMSHSRGPLVGWNAPMMKMLPEHQRRMELARENHEMAECTFQPLISKRSQDLAKRRMRAEAAAATRSAEAGHNVTLYSKGGMGGLTSPSNGGVDGTGDLGVSAYSDGDSTNPGGASLGSTHEALFLDAERRRLKKDRAERSGVTEECTFAPDIGSERLRPHVDVSHASFIDRLTNEREERERRLDDLRLRLTSVDESTGQPLFHPKTGRAPNYERNSANAPIGDYLFAARHEFDDIKNRLAEREAQELESERSRSRVSETSRQVLHHLNERRCSEIFDELVAAQQQQRQGSGDRTSPLQCISIEEILSYSVLDELPEELKGCVVALLEAHAGEAVLRESFVEELGARIAGSGRVGPPAATRLNSAGGEVPPLPESARVALEREAANCTFAPAVDRHSMAIASHRGRGSKPIEEVLLHERDITRRKVERERERLAKLELEECTFKPELLNQAAAQAAFRRLYGIDDGAKSPAKAGRDVTRPTQASLHQRFVEPSEGEVSPSNTAPTHAASAAPPSAPTEARPATLLQNNTPRRIRGGGGGVAATKSG